MYGSPLDRQMSMPPVGTSAMPMEGPLEGNAFTKAMADTGGDYEAAQEILKNQESPNTMRSPLEFHGGPHGRTVLGQRYSLGAENYADSVRVAKREKRFKEMMKPKMTKTITNMPYTKEQLEARNKSIKKSEAQEILRSEAQEIPRIRK